MAPIFFLLENIAVNADFLWVIICTEAQAVIGERRAQLVLFPLGHNRTFQREWGRNAARAEMRCDPEGFRFT